MVELPEEEWPAERKWKACGRTRGWYIGKLSKAVYEKFGEDGLKVLGVVWKEGADRYFLKGLKSFGIEGEDAKSYALYFKRAQEIIGLKMELVEASEKRAVLRYHTCHLFDKSDPIAEKICRETIFNLEKELLNF